MSRRWDKSPRRKAIYADGPAAVRIEPHTRPWTSIRCHATAALRTVPGLSDTERLGFCEACGRAVKVVPVAR